MPDLAQKWSLLDSPLDKACVGSELWGARSVGGQLTSACSSPLSLSVRASYQAGKPCPTGQRGRSAAPDSRWCQRPKGERVLKRAGVPRLLALHPLPNKGGNPFLNCL